MAEEAVIQLSQFIAHPPEKVWAALTEPERIAKWWAPGDIRPVVGHRFTLDMGKWGQQPCEILAVEEGRMISYSFSKGMVITFRITPEGQGTRLFLDHRGFDMNSPIGRTAYEGMGNGWPAVLARIEPSLDQDAAG